MSVSTEASVVSIHETPSDVYRITYTSVCPRAGPGRAGPGRGPVRGPAINYTGPRDVLLEFVILVF